MPWTANDAKKHKKGLTSAERRQWAAVANSVLQKTGNEAQAIQSANAAVNKRRKTIRERWFGV